MERATWLKELCGQAAKTTGIGGAVAYRSAAVFQLGEPSDSDTQAAAAVPCAAWCALTWSTRPRARRYCSRRRLQAELPAALAKELGGDSIIDLGKGSKGAEIAGNAVVNARMKHAT